MAIGLFSELVRKNDDNFTWLSLTNNEIGLAIPEFTEALLQNVSLRKVSCHAGFLGSLEEEDLLLLVKALGQLPYLQDLWVALPPKQAHLSASVLKALFGTTTTSSTTTEVSSGEGRKSHLRKLTLRGMDDEGCRVLGSALSGGDPAEQQKACFLTDLQIRGTTASVANLGDGLQSQVTREGILSIVNMLKVNTSLERLDMSYKGLDDESLEAMAQALSVNKKIQKLELNCPSSKNANKEGLTKNGYQAMVDMMRSNYSIQYLSISPALEEEDNNNSSGGSSLKYMMELLAKLNRTGARALMRNTTDHTGLEDVLETMQDYSNDVTALFELLHLNPSLWDPVKANVTGPMSKNNNSPARRVLKEKATFGGNKRSSFVKPPSDKASDSFASTIAQVAQRSSASSASNNKSGYGTFRPNVAQVAASTSGPAKRGSSVCKPVMARWNEDIFSKLEEEKRQNYKRWTPAVFEKEGNNSNGSIPAAELTSASEESGSESDSSTPPPEAAVLRKSPQAKRAWKRRSTAVISYDVPAVVAAPPRPMAAAKIGRTAPEPTTIEAKTTAADEAVESLDLKPAALKRAPENTEAQSTDGVASASAASDSEIAAAAAAQKSKTKKRTSRRRGPIEISYDVPAVVSASPANTFFTKESSQRTNKVAPKDPPTKVPAPKNSITLGATTTGTPAAQVATNDKSGSSSEKQANSLRSSSLPNINTERDMGSGQHDAPSSPMSPPAVYDALAFIGSAMLRTLSIGRNKSW